MNVFGTFLPECYNCGRRVGYAHYPAADKDFSRQVTPIVYLTAPLYVALWCGLAVCFRSNVPNLFVAIYAQIFTYLQNFGIILPVQITE